MADDADLFAAFDEAGNVRGVAAQLIAGFGPYEGQTYYEMTMRSNAAGDLISFKYYDASEDSVLTVAETYEFVVNDQWGHLVTGAAEFNIDVEDFSCPQGTVFVENYLDEGNICVPIELSIVSQSMQQAFYYFTVVLINEEEVEANDWVGAFKGDVCVGARKWDTTGFCSDNQFTDETACIEAGLAWTWNQCGGGVCDVPVFGDSGPINEDYYPTEGYMHPFGIPSFKIYDASENTYYDAV
ncbi:uncharacterized protein METZ01_LOCUS475872, partial [marine metagenome]